MTIVKGFEDFWLIVKNVVGFFVAEEAEVFHFFLLWHDFFFLILNTTLIVVEEGMELRKDADIAPAIVGSDAFPEFFESI